MNPSASSGFRLACVGDVLVADRSLVAVRREGIASAASRIWASVEGADVVLANLEVPITEGASLRTNKRYNFRTSGDVLALFDQRFVLSLANNHILDYGQRGLLDTIEALDARGIPHTGAGRDLEAARQPVVISVGGVRFGVLCAAAPRFQPATATACGTFPAQPELLRESLRELKGQADIIAVSIHDGIEFFPLPTPRQVRLSRLCLEEGARVVSFHHSHCLSGMWKDDRGVVFFGLGDYVFPAITAPTSRIRRESAAWQIAFAPDHRPARVDAHPVYLDEHGLPATVSGALARGILHRLENYSRQVQQERCLLWWTLWQRVQPDHLQVLLSRCLDLVHRRRYRSLVGFLAEQFIAHFR